MESRQSPSARYLWAVLLARIYEALPLICPHCGAEMRLIAAITDKPSIERILSHIGEPRRPPRVTPARGPPECEWDFDDPHGRGKCRLCRKQLSASVPWPMLSSPSRTTNLISAIVPDMALPPTSMWSNASVGNSLDHPCFGMASCYSQGRDVCRFCMEQKPVVQYTTKMTKSANQCQIGPP